ncbi:MAG: hypothetical protein R3A48_25385 [Polyangiales bacterium]
MKTLGLAAHAASAQAQWIERLSAAREALDEGDAGAARAEFTAIAAQGDDPRSAASARYYLAALDDEAYRFADARSGLPPRRSAWTRARASRGDPRAGAGARGPPRRLRAPRGPGAGAPALERPRGPRARLARDARG